MMSKYNQNRFQKPIPVKEGETYDVTIESIGTKGDGIAKIDGYVVIVPQAQKGEQLKVKINAIRGKVSFGEIVENLGEAEPKEEESTDEKDLTEDSDSTEEKPSEEESEKTPEETLEDEPKEKESSDEKDLTEDAESTEDKSVEDSTEETSEEDPKEEKKQEE